MSAETYKPNDTMKNVLSHDIPQSDSAINVNVAMLTAAEKKVLQNSPARETCGGMVRIPADKVHKAVQNVSAQALHDANPSPVTRSKGRSSGGGSSSIVF